MRNRPLLQMIAFAVVSTAVLLAMPPDETIWVPPLIRAPEAVPPKETISVPPAATVVPLAVPPAEMISKPPAPTGSRR